MHVQQDWFMRQIEQIVSFIIFLVTGKKTKIETIKKDELESNELYTKLHRLVLSNRICEAENLLYEMDCNEKTFIAAMLFYLEINELPDEKLEKCDFSREEIADGIQNYCHRYDTEMELPFDILQSFK